MNFHAFNSSLRNALGWFGIGAEPTELLKSQSIDDNFIDVSFDVFPGQPTRIIRCHAIPEVGTGQWQVYQFGKIWNVFSHCVANAQHWVAAPVVPRMTPVEFGEFANWYQQTQNLQASADSSARVNKHVLSCYRALLVDGLTEQRFRDLHFRSVSQAMWERQRVHYFCGMNACVLHFRSSKCAVR